MIHEFARREFAEIAQAAESAREEIERLPQYEKATLQRNDPFGWAVPAKCRDAQVGKNTAEVYEYRGIEGEIDADVHSFLIDGHPFSVVGILKKG